MKFINKIHSTHYRHAGAACLLVIILFTSCKKYLDIPLPVDSVADQGGYVSDNSVSAVVSGIFVGFYNNSAIGGTESIGYRTGLYTDELQNVSPTNMANQAFYTDNIQSGNVAQWPALYKLIYSCNVAIEGINTTPATLYNRNQWMGEVFFMRALLYYYLTNVYGDVPLALTSNYITNNKLSRSPKSEVYNQIIADLKQAQTLLTTDYKDGFSVVTADRGRPNKNAATALLARVYLYSGDWSNAETQATTIISNTAYQLVAPAGVFLAASKETIWAVAPIATSFVKDWASYNNNMPASIISTQTPSSFLVNVAMSTPLYNSFETGDARATAWIRSSTVAASATAPAITYYFPNKYKTNVSGAEYQVILRLAEQYLIRAEARAQQNNITGAKADLDAVRARANLAGTTAANKDDMLAAILKERRIELFSELGHRFFDLKRTNTIDAVMNIAAAQKGGTWSNQKQIWPIPSADIQVNPNLVQAPGYQ